MGMASVSSTTYCRCTGRLRATNLKKFRNYPAEITNFLEPVAASSGDGGGSLVDLASPAKSELLKRDYDIYCDQSTGKVK